MSAPHTPIPLKADAATTGPTTTSVAALVQQTIFASLLASLAPVSAAGPRSSNPRIEGLICVRP
jgi:hypothetical protein